jgi:secreted Zn-dependent insulinase-like peptidase
MKTNNKMYKQRTYSTPLIKRIKLDNEISLVLASDPPVYEKANFSSAPEYFNNDPFKMA